MPVDAVGEQVELSLSDDLNLAEDDEDELLFTDSGIPIEPFNLKAERRGGYFDAEGNYLAYRSVDDTDAWLQTLPGTANLCSRSLNCRSMKAKSPCSSSCI